MNGKDLLYARMRQIVILENRPFTIKDLEKFSMNDKLYSFSNGTIRNICSLLRSEHKIFLVKRSSQAYYTVDGVRFEKPMTIPSAGVAISKEVRQYMKIFDVHKLDNPSIHNIRLNFTSDVLVKILQSNRSNFVHHFDKSNKNTVLKDIHSDDLTIKTMIHNSGLVSVAVACSDTPITFDEYGLFRLVRGLTRLEERLQGELDNYYYNIHQVELPSLPSSNYNPDTIVSGNSGAYCKVIPPVDYSDNTISIPHLNTWIVSMWHFAQDSKSLHVDGLTFNITLKDGIDFFRAYSKKRKVRRNAL